MYKRHHKCWLVISRKKTISPQSSTFLPKRGKFIIVNNIITVTNINCDRFIAGWKLESILCNVRLLNINSSLTTCIGPPHVCWRFLFVFHSWLHTFPPQSHWQQVPAGSTQFARLLDEEGLGWVRLLHRRAQSAVPHTHGGLWEVMTQLFKRSSHEDTDLLHPISSGKGPWLVRPLGFLLRVHMSRVVLPGLLRHPFASSLYCRRMSSLQQMRLHSRFG